MKGRLIRRSPFHKIRRNFRNRKHIVNRSFNYSRGVYNGYYKRKYYKNRKRIFYRRKIKKIDGNGLNKELDNYFEKNEPKKKEENDAEMKIEENKKEEKV